MYILVQVERIVRYRKAYLELASVVPLIDMYFNK